MCTFAAIPVVGSLITMGVPAAPLIAFMAASPLMNPALFMYTAGIIGLEMAMARLLTALAVGVSAGYAAHYAIGRGLLDFPNIRLGKVPQGLYPGSRTGREGRQRSRQRCWAADSWAT